MAIVNKAAMLRPAGWLAAACIGLAIPAIGVLYMTASIAAGDAGAVEIVSAGNDVNIPDDAAAIDIKEFNYTPGSITVSQKATVVWTNREPFDHDVTFQSSELLAEELKSPKVGKGGMIVVRFNEPGEYRYYCRLHPFMEGTVKVEAR